MMFKYRIRMFFNELKLLVLMRRGRPEPEPGAGGNRAPGGSGCGWPPFADCSARQDDEAEYYGGVAEPRPRSLALEEKEPRSSLDSGMRTPQCRICFQGPEQGELLSPCRCDGSVRCTHQPCLIRWISERGSWSCELCYFKYQVLAISTKNPLQWQAISLTVIEKVQIAAIILGSLFLIASISWLIWSSLSPSAKWQRQDLLFQICYGMYGFMDVVCIGLIIHGGSSVYRIFKAVAGSEQQWKVAELRQARTWASPTILNHHCGYTIFPAGCASSGREVVMRTPSWVTTMGALTARRPCSEHPCALLSALP
uniref:RING-type E3 ubiquitin transferase n=1 Tax=Chelonoidis abingdonii TaxID=106734 RepID=A0A8C0GJL4_CHEAB